MENGDREHAGADRKVHKKGLKINGGKNRTAKSGSHILQAAVGQVYRRDGQRNTGTKQ
jgi:hypothetical protein